MTTAKLAALKLNQEIEDFKKSYEKKMDKDLLDDMVWELQDLAETAYQLGYNVRRNEE